MVTQPFVDPISAGPKGEQVQVLSPQGELRNAQRYRRRGEAQSELQSLLDQGFKISPVTDEQKSKLQGATSTKPRITEGRMLYSSTNQGIPTGGQSELTQTAKNTVLREAEVKFGAVLPQVLTEIYI